MREFLCPWPVCVDAYQATHFGLIPSGMENLQVSQGVFRKPLDVGIPLNNNWNMDQGNNTYVLISAGLQLFVELNLRQPITQADIEEADHFYQTFGVGGAYPWPKQMFETIVNKYGGYIPVCIMGMPDGEAHFVGEPHVQVWTDEPGMGECVGWIESTLLPYLWTSSIVATRGRVRKQMMMDVFQAAYPSKSKDEICMMAEYQFHDFGRRGGAAAQITGIAHLYNFLGTDTVDAAYVAQKYLNGGEPFGACSVVAAAHRTVTPWKTEIDAYKHAVKHFGNQILSIVGDSYDQTKGFQLLAGFAEEIKEKKGKLVGRVDSGDVVEAVVESLHIFAESFGTTTNETGLKVLMNSAVLQGDGINDYDMKRIYDAVIENGFCPTNVVFGMGENNHKAVRSETEAGYKTCLVGSDDGVRQVMKFSNSPFKKSIPCAVGYDSWTYELRKAPWRIYPIDLERLKRGDAGDYVVYYDGRSNPLKTQSVNFMETRDRCYKADRLKYIGPSYTIHPDIDKMQTEYFKNI